MKHKGSFVALVTAIVTLWVPVRQHDFLLEHWMKVSTFVARFLSLVAFLFAKDRDLRTEPSSLSLILLVGYIVHQFEEHCVFGLRATMPFQAHAWQQSQQ